MCSTGVRDIERFRASRLATDIGAATANKDLTILKRLFNLAILRRYLIKGGNPCNEVPKLKIGSTRKVINICSRMMTVALMSVYQLA